MPRNADNVATPEPWKSLDRIVVERDPLAKAPPRMEILVPAPTTTLAQSSLTPVERAVEEGDMLGQARRWCQQASPIFICGPARSGTSILTVSLARHSQLFAPQGVGETFAFARPQALREVPVRKGVKKYLGASKAVNSFQKLISELEVERRLSDRDIIELFFFFAGTRIYPGLRPLEKTPSHVSNLNQIFDTFPHAKVIVTLRDPVDIVTSYRKRLKQERESGHDQEVWGWLEKSADRLITRFRRIHKDLVSARDADAGNIFLAPYSWITADPQSRDTKYPRFCKLADRGGGF